MCCCHSGLFYHHPTIIMIFRVISSRKVFFPILWVIDSLRYMWVGLHCHTQGLSAVFTLIAINSARSPCVDGVTRKVHLYCIRYHMFAIILFSYSENFWRGCAAPLFDGFIPRTPRQPPAILSSTPQLARAPTWPQWAVSWLVAARLMIF